MRVQNKGKSESCHFPLLFQSTLTFLFPATAAPPSPLCLLLSRKKCILVCIVQEEAQQCILMLPDSDYVEYDQINGAFFN